MKVEGSRIVVVGGSSGIGQETAAAAVRAGARAVIGARDPERLERARDVTGADALQVDAGDLSSLARFFDAIGPFDHLVLAASGGRGAGPLQSLSEIDLEGAFQAKFWVHWRTLKAGLTGLAPTGSITFVSAASARASNPGTSGLAAVNGAINAMVGPLARELAPRRVNAVAPGVIATPWWDGQPAGIREAFFERSRETLPVGRVGQAQEVAEAILFLVGNGFTTGVVLDVDGGLRISGAG